MPGVLVRGVRATRRDLLVATPQAQRRSALVLISVLTPVAVALAVTVGDPARRGLLIVGALAAALLAVAVLRFGHRGERFWIAALLYVPVPLLICQVTMGDNADILGVFAFAIVAWACVFGTPRVAATGFCIGVAIVLGAVLLDTLQVTGSTGPSRRELGNAAARLVVLVLMTAVVRGLTSSLRASTSEVARIAASVDELLYALYRTPTGTRALVWTAPAAGFLGMPTEPEPTFADWAAAVHPDDRSAIAVMGSAIANGEDYEVEYRLVGVDGVERRVSDRARRRAAEPVWDGIVSDITERHRLESQLRRTVDEMRIVNAALEEARAAAEGQARRDPLTGLANRRAFAERLAQLCERLGSRGGVVLIDVDYFKALNDRLGHDAGDAALLAAGQRILEAVPEDALVARIGGDEFAVLLDCVAEESIADVAERIRRRLTDAPVGMAVGHVSLSASLGAALYGLHGTTPDELMRSADAGLYQAKRTGRNRACVSDDATVPEAAPPDAVAQARELGLTLTLRSGASELHADEVGEIAATIASRLGLDAMAVQRCRIAGLLHDIGKVALADHILRKPSALDPSEQHAFAAHAVIGARLVARIPLLADAAPAVRHHHERWDGTGYPDLLRGPSIPIEARIVAVADAYSSMRQPRPWRPALTEAAARNALRIEAGSHFDPAIAFAHNEVWLELVLCAADLIDS